MKNQERIYTYRIDCSYRHSWYFGTFLLYLPLWDMRKMRNSLSVKVI